LTASYVVTNCPANGIQHRHATFRDHGNPFRSLGCSSFLFPLNSMLWPPRIPITLRLWNLIDVLACIAFIVTYQMMGGGDSFSPKLITVVQRSRSCSKTSYGGIRWCSRWLTIPPSTVWAFHEVRGQVTSERNWDCPFQFCFSEHL